MDFRVGSYLCSPRPVSIGPSKKQSLCIAETRQCFWLPKVIANAKEQFPGWPVYVCAPLHVLQWLAVDFPDIVPVVMQGAHTRDTFNQLMYSDVFWALFDTEYVLMLQCDVVLFDHAHSHQVFQNPVHAFYGAACGRLEDNQFVINGGLSLRSVEAFSRAVCMLTDEQKKKGDEDVVFTEYFRRKGESLPTLTECMQFAIESFGNPRTAIGMHGTDKGYCHPAVITAALGSSPRQIVDCVMYDGEPILTKRLALLERVVDTFIVVESTMSHSGEPKELQFPKHFPNGHPKVQHVVVDSFPEMPPDFGSEYPWVIEASRESWWKEKYQRDMARGHVPSTSARTMVIVSDVDEIPNPDVLIRLAKSTEIDDEPVHLHMPFLLYSPDWMRPQETWTRAFVCSVKTMPESFTDQRCKSNERVTGHAGWHCSSFFDVDTHIRKVKHFAHREHGKETDASVVTDRMQHGKDPYGRPGMDATKTDVFAFLKYVDS
jgi:beta-1,4-mannosyl-glycoprotein beta-1,4-N-acetylglucosaminyltransferase